MTSLEEAYYLGVMEYVKTVYDGDGYSRDVRRTLKHYLATSGISKLQLGSGFAAPPGWLGTDIIPQSDGVMYLDATKPFPFDDDTFEYIHSEHMIEHISWHEGLFMLRECRRVLKPGGTIRIATPDLEVLLGLYKRKQASLLDERYIKWITDTFMAGLNNYKAAFVINNAFRNWGHQFLYDGELMEMAMLETGFTNIRRCAVGESNDENLRGIESHGMNAVDEELIAFETMVFEGDCSA